MRSHHLAFAAVAALVLSFAGSASAQTTGYAINRFESSERGSQFFVVDNLDLHTRTKPALGAVVDYSYKPLVVYNPNGDERAALVRHQASLNLGGSFVLNDRVRLAANLPLAVYQDGEATVVNGEAFKPADKPAVGDLRLAVDVRLVGEKSDPFTLAIGLRAWAPTGPREQFAGDGSWRVGPQVLAGGDLGIFTYGARLGLVYRARDDVYGGTELGSEINGALGAGIKVLDGGLVIGPEVFAGSVFSGTDTFLKTRTSPAEGLFGLHWEVVQNVRIGAGVGTGLTRGYGSPQLRGLFSLEFAPGVERSDRDHDGILDDKDACPAVPGLADPDPEKNGCPPPPPPPPKTDTDEDGINDNEDACPTVPGPRTVNPKTSGCPDLDHDDIPDPVDACREDPGIPTDDPKTNGCPDRDGDGIPDIVDACPDVKGIKTDNPKTNGCQPVTDADGDGILDADDACPSVAGPKNADPKKNGCPLVTVTDKEIKIGEQVKFKTNSAEILKESDGILEAVRAVLEAHPEITKLRIEGHTDNAGNAAANKVLSAKRAASVTKWLTDRKVDKDRLSSAGFGSEQPIDVNTTEEGRANNRRVAFAIVEKDDTKKAPAPQP